VEESLRLATTPAAKHFYSRHGNPTVAAFEDAVCALEGAEAAQAFASGMGAISSTVLGLCSSGDHIVAQRQLYSATSMLLRGTCPRFGIDVTFVDGTDAGAIADAVIPGRTVMVYVETPANPLLQLVDLEAVAKIKGPVKVVDSTFAGPMVQRPLEHGLDLVVHSATKGLSGHNDATLGVIAGATDLVHWIWNHHTIHGAVASPFDALNGLRGIRTLGVRVRQQSASAERLAQFLATHPSVERVHYPGHESHPQRELAKRQMELGGTVLSFDVAGGWEAGRRFAEATRLAQLAPSLGGPDTLVTHPASSTAAALTPEERAAIGIGDGLVRLSIGLEHTDDIVADVAQALEVAAAGAD
jgi:cystathionine beta-lyase/cystathionine gamma-synthase